MIATLTAVSTVEGCYAYVPRQTTGPVANGRTYRAELTDSGVVAMASQLGPGVYLLDGRAIAADERSITLAASTLTSRRTNTEQFWNGEAVVLPRSSLAALRERALSRGRTAGLVALSAGALAALFAAFSTQGFGGGGGRGGGGNGQ